MKWKTLKIIFIKLFIFFKKLLAIGLLVNGMKLLVQFKMQKVCIIFFFVYVILFWITHPWVRYPKENVITSLYFCIFACQFHFLHKCFLCKNPLIFIFKGKVVQHLFGICTEALYCGQAPSTRCIWRPGALPNDSELYYGFSRYKKENSIYIFFLSLFFRQVAYLFQFFIR